MMSLSGTCPNIRDNEFNLINKNMRLSKNLNLTEIISNYCLDEKPGKQTKKSKYYV